VTEDGHHILRISLLQTAICSHGRMTIDLLSMTTAPVASITSSVTHLFS